MWYQDPVLLATLGVGLIGLFLILTALVRLAINLWRRPAVTNPIELVTTGPVTANAAVPNSTSVNSAAPASGPSADQFDIV